MEEKSSLLLVDDVADNIHLLREVLKADYHTRAALRGEDALRICRSDDPPDLVLLDVMMPEMDGYEVCRRLKADPQTADIPVIFVTAKGEVEDECQGLALGAVDYITKPIRAPIVENRVKAQLNLYDQRRHLEHLVAERTQELEQAKLEVIFRLGRAAEFKDEETGNHVKRMSHYSAILAARTGMDGEFTKRILRAAPMHDIGKIGIPDGILRKEDKLDEQEWEIMRSHCAIGARILDGGTSPLLHLAQEIAFTHHERWDGKGYPQGLVGDAIPIAGRIVAVADVFDALTSQRPYKKAWSVEKALEHLQEESGKHFDPALVEAFLDCLDEVLEIRETFALDG